MDIATAILGLITGGIGGLAGATIGAYYGGYNRRKGEIFAEYEDFPTLIAQEARKAYEQEWAKRLATHKDIQNVLDEIKKVTTETESIKAQISGDAWLRQTVWVQKREAYASVIKAVDAVVDAYKGVSKSLVSLEGSKADPDSGERVSLKLDLGNKTSRALDSLFELTQRFGETELFDQTIGQQYTAFRVIDGFEAVLKGTATAAEIGAFMVKLMEFRRKLVSHMRKALGIPEPPTLASP